MTWAPYYRGDGEKRAVELPPPPPWRRLPSSSADGDASGEGGDAEDTFRFDPPEGLVDAVNAALYLRRPLLLTGPPGSGKSAVAESVARELGLGEVLRWHITSRSTLPDALYGYDALGRLDATRHHEDDDIGRFIRLGPLGTALAWSDGPRVLLIDEIDKSDFDLPSDLLNILERGEFEIPELARHDKTTVSVRRWDATGAEDISSGRVTCTHFPVIVMTSNGERSFPPPFLRRCVRFQVKDPSAERLARIVRAHLGDEAAASVQQLIQGFAERLEGRATLATDQLLNAVYLVTGELPPEGRQREELEALLLRDLSST
ncbi:AAA family ATPase [Streptomyces sp. 8N616]|uniref:AAA family ATPase n=1 Tax=Streptomyces sp. 8N616 TaxID=3457414 RepID=UPI003FD182A2